MSRLRLALFVEGGQDPVEKRRFPPLEEAWQQLLQASVGDTTVAWNLIVPISKKHLLAMDPTLPPMSGASEGLDALMARKLKVTSFDAAVVAWDLWPRWHKVDSACRRRETMDLYRLLAQSPHLDASWRAKAARRHHTLSQRSFSGAIQQFDVIAICMEPMFEALLTGHEVHVRRALIGNHPRPSGWPARDWNTAPRPDADLLKPAIDSLGWIRPPPAAMRGIGRRYEQTKNHWNAWILREMLADQEARISLLQHRIPSRIREKLGK